MAFSQLWLSSFGLVGVVEIGYSASYALLAILSVAAAVWQWQSTKPLQTSS